MAHADGLNRRAFLQNAGMTAVFGALGAGSSPALAAAGAAFEPANGKYDFDTIYNRFGTDSIKFDQQIRTFGKDSIEVGMGIADMDFKVAPAITRALNERMGHENWGYLDMPPSYAQGIIDWNKRRYNAAIDPETLILTAGVHPGIIATLKTFSPPGSRVLLQTPTYNGFYSDLTAAQVKAEESPLKLVNGRYEMDFDDLERRISHDTNTLILCNPQNPTGNCWSRDDLTRLGEICTRRRVVVLADEIHCDFVTKGNKYTPYSTLDPEIVKNSITFKAASKSFGLAAMKSAWMFSTNRDYLERIKVHHRADLNTMGVIANRAAYTTEGEDWLNQVVEYIDGTHDYVQSYVKANIPMIKVLKPQGTYLCWLDVSEVQARIGAKELAAEANRKKAPSAATVTPEHIVEKFFVKRAKVHLNAGHTYGGGGQGHMRMNIATSRKLVEVALNNIASALRNPQMSMAD
jgi:cystathionine beta-lyase